MSPANPWRPLLHDRFAGQPLPLLHSGPETWTAASLWSGSRQWVSAFRTMGLAPGDRVVIALKSAPAFVQVLIAALWEELTIVPCPPDEEIGSTAAHLDARLVIVEPSAASDSQRNVEGAFNGCAVMTPGESHLPVAPYPSLSAARGPATPSARFLLRTSGSTGVGRWIALSDAGVLSVLESHAGPLALNDARVLSVLPWHHVFGLVLDLLAALLAGAEVIRESRAGADPELLCSLAAHFGATHLNAVPLTVVRLAQSEAGRALLTELHGGLIGGAPVRGEALAAVQGTRLRVGYGQTEASPGIALGVPGAWRAATLGVPVGCEVRIAEDGALWFRGLNACIGEWHEGTLRLHDPDRWVDTGDVVRQEHDGSLTFLGRSGSSFKMENGRLVEVARTEEALRRAIPHATEIALTCADGRVLDIWMAIPGDDTPPGPLLDDAMGALARMPRRQHRVLPQDWPWTPKGETDRRALLQLLARD